MKNVSDHRLARDSGQATTEMVILLPMMMILASIAIGVAYMCWQGIKVQEAANYAARVEGQERVAGGSTSISIDRVNGVGSGQTGDADISDPSIDPNSITPASSGSRRTGSSVYVRYSNAVKSMFGVQEQAGLFVPLPHIGNEIDEVKVSRLMTPPSVFGIQIPKVIVTGTAYGGEDSNMYGLPRFGCTGANDTNPCLTNQQFWTQGAALKGENTQTANPIK